MITISNNYPTTAGKILAQNFFEKSGVAKEQASAGSAALVEGGTTKAEQAYMRQLQEKTRKQSKGEIGATQPLLVSRYIQHRSNHGFTEDEVGKGRVKSSGVQKSHTYGTGQSVVHVPSRTFFITFNDQLTLYINCIFSCVFEFNMGASSRVAMVTVPRTYGDVFRTIRPFVPSHLHLVLRETVVFSNFLPFVPCQVQEIVHWFLYHPFDRNSILVFLLRQGYAAEPWMIQHAVKDVVPRVQLFEDGTFLGVRDF